MKVGVYLGNFDPFSGGENTIQKTIINELREIESSQYEFIFFYSGDIGTGKKKQIGDSTFYNINRQYSIVKKLQKHIFSILNSTRECNYYLFDIIGKKYGIDIFWITVPCNIDITYPYIYTVWDLGHRTIPFFPEVRAGRQWMSRENRYSKMIPRAVYVLTGNETGKNEIINNYLISPDRVHIAPFPVSKFCFGEEIKPRFEIPEAFFFYPAQFWPHKNHVCIIEAIKELKEKYNVDVKVFLTGADHGNKGYIERIAESYNIGDSVIFTGFVSDEEMKYLYTHATAMVYASLLGPNNLPPLEALYLGCPIIITDLAGHKEQLGDCAEYFDGYNPKQLAECMYRMVTDKEERSFLIEKEHEKAELLSEYKYCSNIIDILDEFSSIRKRWE